MNPRHVILKHESPLIQVVHGAYSWSAQPGWNNYEALLSATDLYTIEWVMAYNPTIHLHHKYTACTVLIITWYILGQRCSGWSSIKLHVTCTSTSLTCWIGNYQLHRLQTVEKCINLEVLNILKSSIIFFIHFILSLTRIKVGKNYIYIYITYNIYGNIHVHVICIHVQIETNMPI